LLLLIQGKKKEAYGGQIRSLPSIEEKKIALAEKGDIKRLKEEELKDDDEDPEDSKLVLYEFAERDVLDPNVDLREGDLIRYNIFLEKRSGRKGATNIRLVRPNPRGRTNGKVVDVGDHFCFVQCSDSRFGKLFFHFSELLLPKDHKLQMNDEVEFLVERDRDDKLVCTRGTLLPKGTVKFDRVSKRTFRGSIEEDFFIPSVRGQRRGSGDEEQRRDEAAKIKGKVRLVGPYRSAKERRRSQTKKEEGAVMKNNGVTKLPKLKAKFG